jgi:hypothetical protein
MSGQGTEVNVVAVPTNVNTETPVMTIPYAGAGARETVVGWLPGQGGFVKLAVGGTMNITPGASTTAVVVRLRRGANSVAGLQIGISETETDAAGVPLNVSFEFGDSTAPPGTAYTVTVQQTAGTGAGTVNYGSCRAWDYS